MLGDGRLNPGDGRGHALHGVRIEQVFDAGVKEEISLGRSAHAALCQQLGHDQGIPALCARSVAAGFAWGRTHALRGTAGSDWVA